MSNSSNPLNYPDCLKKAIADTQGPQSGEVNLEIKVVDGQVFVLSMIYTYPERMHLADFEYEYSGHSKGASVWDDSWDDLLEDDWTLY